MKKDYNVFGFKFNTKNTLITLGIALAVFIVLLIFHLFIKEVSWYGVIIGVGFLMALFVASQNAKYRNHDKDFPYDLIWFVFPLAIIGARLGYVINALNEFPTFLDVLAIWNGGLSILGGVAGGAIGLILCCIIKKKNIITTMDFVAPALILGQAIGRWGNFVNQEVYGFEITNKSLQWFPIGVFISKDGINQWHLALFFWESVLNIIGFILLTKLLRKCKIKGIVVSSYLVFYGFIRAILENFRIEEFILKFPGTSIPFSMVTSIVICLIGLILVGVLLYLNKKRPELVNMEVSSTIETIKNNIKQNDTISEIENDNNLTREESELLETKNLNQTLKKDNNLNKTKKNASNKNKSDKK